MLRRKAVEYFKEKIVEMDIVSMPVNEKNTLPINLDSAMVTYFIKDVGYNTEGHKTSNLSGLHKEIEALIGATFGSYNFYDQMKPYSLGKKVENLFGFCYNDRYAKGEEVQNGERISRE